jgi:hypothetical protein
LKGGDLDGRREAEFLRVWLHARHPKKREEKFRCSEAGGQEAQEVMVLAKAALTGGGVSPPVIFFNNMVVSNEIME